jgi:sigma-B regulation protein RsbU (phosphoserine phosphatase)
MTRRTLALLLDHPIGEYQDELRESVERAALAADANLLIVIGRALDAPRPGELALNRIYGQLSARSVSGVIISGVVGTQCAEQRLLDLRDHFAPLPMCSIGVRIPSVPALAINDRRAMRLMVDHMVSHGCRRIAFIRGPSTSEEAAQRYQAYRDCLQDHQIPLDPSIVAIGNFDIASGIVAMEQIVASGQPFDAMVASNDNMALGAAEVLLAHKIRIPHQVLVGGFDDFPMARFANPPLTTVRQPIRKLGERAVSSLLEQLAGSKVPEIEEVGSELVLRQSCGCAYRVIHGRRSVLPQAPDQGPLDVLRSRGLQLKTLLLEAVQLPEQALGGWLGRLLAALEAELQGSAGRFLLELEDLLELAMRQHQAIDEFHAAISVLRAELKGRDGGRRAGQVLDDLWHAAGVLVGIASARAEGRERMASEAAAQVIRESIARLSTTLSHDALKAGLLDLLPAVKIPRSLVALYEQGDQHTFRYFFGTAGQQELSIAAPTFAVTELLPAGFAPDDSPISVMVQPLTFETEHLGLLLLQSGASSVVYDILREQISASLKGASLHQSVVKQTTLRERAERAQLEGELRIAERIQTAILPVDVHVPWLDIAAKMVPASEVGGDYYDILPAGDSCWLGIGDVTGHGLRAGLVMLMIQSMVSALLEHSPRAEPAALVNFLNAALYRNVRERLQLDDHATFSLLRLDADGKLSWAGAHEDLIVLRARDGKCEVYPPAGAWIGARRDIAHAITSQSVQLEPGDRLVLYTDGLIEAMDSRNEQFSLERVLSLLEAGAGSSNESLCNTLIEAAQRFAISQLDDITVVVLRYQPPVAPSKA